MNEGRHSLTLKVNYLATPEEDAATRKLFAPITQPDGPVDWGVTITEPLTREEAEELGVFLVKVQKRIDAVRDKKFISQQSP